MKHSHTSGEWKERRVGVSGVTMDNLIINSLTIFAEIERQIRIRLILDVFNRTPFYNFLLLG